MHPRLVDRDQGGEAFGQRDARGVCRDVAQAVEQAGGLVGGGLDDARMTVADGGDPEAGCEIQEPVAVDVEDVGAEGFGPDQAGGGADEGVDPRRLGGGQGAGEGAGGGPGRWGDDLGQEVAAGERWAGDRQV